MYFNFLQNSKKILIHNAIFNDKEKNIKAIIKNYD